MGLSGLYGMGERLNKTRGTEEGRIYHPFLKERRGMFLNTPRKRGGPGIWISASSAQGEGL